MDHESKYNLENKWLLTVMLAGSNHVTVVIVLNILPWAVTVSRSWLAGSISAFDFAKNSPGSIRGPHKQVLLISYVYGTVPPAHSIVGDKLWYGEVWFEIIL